MCTAIKVDYTNGNIIARNMDFDYDIDYGIVHIPRDYNYGVDLFGNHLKSKYRYMGIGFKEKDVIKDGINEFGLMGITNLFITLNLYHGKVIENKINLKSLDLLNYILGSFKNVDEVIENIENINISTRDYKNNKVICPEFHYLISDIYGKSIIIETRNNELIVKENICNVMTNSPSLESHIKKLNKFNHSFNNNLNLSKSLPGGYDPSSRFIKAYYLNKTIKKETSLMDALKNTFAILDTVKIPEGFTMTKTDYTYTKYTCAYDCSTLTLYCRSHSNPNVYSISLRDVKNPNERFLIDIPRDFCVNKFL